MRAEIRNLTPEMYLAVAVIISLTLAAILSFVPGVAFGGFLVMAGVLVAADVVLYILMKLGILKTSRGNSPP